MTSTGTTEFRIRAPAATRAPAAPLREFSGIAETGEFAGLERVGARLAVNAGPDL
jgi:hypothetical protein